MIRRTRMIVLGSLMVAATVAVSVVAIGQDAADTSDEPARAVLRTGQHGEQFEATVEKDLRGQYLLFLPEQYGKEGMTWPLIVFLHGSGERGSNLNLVKKHGPPKVAPTQPGFPFVVLSPQCPSGKWWSDPDVTLTVMAMIDKVVADYDIDTSRIYLTGLSMGGFGTWSIAQQYPDRFAALAPLCGGGNPYLQRRLTDMPAWVFHGAKDKNVPLAFAKQMAAALKAAGGDVQLSVYPDLGHDVWTPTYDNPQLYTWFLKHSRKDK